MGVIDNSNDFYQELLESLADGIYFTDTNRQIVYWNKGAEFLSGFSREEVLGKHCRDNILIHVDDSGRELCKNGCPLNDTLKDGQPREAQVYLHHKDGHRVPIRVRVVPRKDSEGTIVGAVEVFNDNSATMKIMERLIQLESMALLDTLTGLGNRRLIDSTICSRLEELRRNQWKFGVLFLDIDNFKTINDTYGHHAGDLVLKMVSRTLKSAARYFDMIGRWGGEEFVAVLANADEKILHAVGTRLRILTQHSKLTEPKNLSVTVSIGGAIAVVGDTTESLLQRADEKLYQAKHAGKNCVCI
jgi:diguanylate cyclase (GGDEF)-like protein/PAS domain S-box-containing protein